MLRSLPLPLREVPPLRKHAADGIRADCILYETHVHEAEWPLKLPITALAGKDDISIEDAHLSEWEMETKRAFKVVRLPGGLSYPREPAGVAALVDLMCETADNPPDEEAYTDSDESFEDPTLAAQRAREAARKSESDNPFSLDAYYPMADDASLADSTSANKYTTDKSNALVAHSVLGKFAHKERKLTGSS